MENVWKLMSDYVYDEKQFEKMIDLEAKIAESVVFINTTKKSVIKSLFSSMPSRLCVVLLCRGVMSKY